MKHAWWLAKVTSLQRIMGVETVVLIAGCFRSRGWFPVPSCMYKPSVVPNLALYEYQVVQSGGNMGKM
jgi:hypothetical protein